MAAPQVAEELKAVTYATPPPMEERRIVFGGGNVSHVNNHHRHKRLTSVKLQFKESLAA